MRNRPSLLLIGAVVAMHLPSDADAGQAGVLLTVDAADPPMDVRVADKLIDVVSKLRELSPLYEMVKEGIDLTKIEWAAH